MNENAFKVEFYEVDSGWLRYNIGDSDFTASFSSYWCPLLDLKHWLEAIALGVEQTSFAYEPEASFDIRFDFSRAVTGKKSIYEGKTFYDKELIDIFTISETKEVCYYNDLAQELYEKKLIIPLITSEKDTVYFQKIVDRKQLVAAFYNAVVNFFNSEKYKPKEWEKGSYKGTPLSKFRSEIIEKYLKENGTRNK